MESVQIPSIQVFVDEKCRQMGDRTLFSVLELTPGENEPIIHSISGNDFHKKLFELQRRQSIAGINAESRVAILGESSIDWIANFISALSRGSTLCPLDVKSTDWELDSLLLHFQATHLLVNDFWWAKAQKFKSILEHRVKLIRFADFSSYPDAILNDLANDSRSEHPTELVLYTSGSTGSPKGVVLPMSAVLFEATILATAFPTPPPEERIVFSLLPLNHVYGLSAGLFVTMGAGFELCLSQSVNPAHIQKIIQERKVRRFFTIPLFLNLIKNSVQAKVKNQPLPKQIIFKTAIWLNQKIRSKTLAQIFFKPIRSFLGDSLELFICGGAPLDRKTAAFFDALCWPVYNGYGLTETGPVVAVNTDRFQRHGSVGKLLPGVEVKVLPIENNENPSVGEIAVKGPNVFDAYYREPVLTSEVKDSQGWFKTGDLGYLDKDGYLHIIGRHKSLLVLASGKKVQPEEVEEIIEQHPQVKASCLTLSKIKNQEILVCIIELREELSSSSETQKIVSEIQQNCEILAPYKRPQEIRIRKTPFAMTSSQKVKRHVVHYELEKGIL